MSKLRDRIIDAALILFEEHGYHGVSVNDIIIKANTSKGGFYHHFQAKDELLFVIHDTFITYALKNAKLATKTYSTPTDKIKAIVRDFVKVFDLYKAHIAVFYQEYNYLSPPYKDLIHKKREEFKQIIMKTVAEGVSSGEFRQDLAVDITGMAILGMVNWTYMWYQQTGEKTIEDIGEIYVDLIMHAVLNRTDITQEILKQKKK